MTSRGSNLRWTVAVVFSLLAGAILIGIRRSGQDVDAAERAYDVGVLHNIADSVGPVVQDLNKIGKGNKKAVRSERQRLKKEGKRGKELPKVKFATSTETVWNYLYQNIDKDLIKYSTSEDELAKKVAKGDENFNAITAMIQKIEAEDANIWLVQLAYWMKTVAVHWPKGIRVKSQRAVSKLEDLLRVDFAFDDKLKAGDIEEIIQNNETIPESHVDVSEMAPEEIKAVQDAKRVVSGLLNRHKITGNVAIKMLNETMYRDDVSIHTWHTTLSFLLGIAEAAPLFEEYLEACQSSTYFSGSKNLYDSDPTSNKEMTSEAVELLTMLESGCDAYPRTNKLIRAIFFNILKSSNDDRTKRVFDDSRR